jgi:pimeloyl-ACP methyl ester carboxylesterase
MKKLLLIHGWNQDNYTSSGCVDAWSNRSPFVEALSKHFEVIRFNLPGFCGESDPPRPWALKDFAEHLGEIIRREKPDYALGYSFGGAVLLEWKVLTDDRAVQAILVSPAIIRHYEHKGISVGLLKHFLPKKLITLARDFYLTKVVKNPYYAKATPVMRETYRNIVGVDLREGLLKVLDRITLIYGEKDTATPPDAVRGFLDSHYSGHKLRVIPGGGHNIANTHTDDLVSIIISSIKE